jgi:hypothetical protein
MNKTMARLSYGFMAIAAIGVALYSLRYSGVPFGVWALIDAGLQVSSAWCPSRP